MSGWNQSHLTYARFDGSTWFTETVAVNLFNCQISLALDSTGRPHIGYIDEINNDLNHAYFPECVPVGGVAVAGPHLGLCRGRRH